ncbi:MAG: SURF1 family protein [Caldilineae bacterium]|nr:MAG: SURF1 family protein [Caldilineae bacterium]
MLPLTVVTESKTGFRLSPWRLAAAMVSRQWRWATLLVLAGMLVLARLGIWQLDRLEQRRARNAQTAQQLALPPLPLTGDPLPADLESLKLRQASARGTFDFGHQIVLKLQNWNDASVPDSLGAPVQAVGVDVITPLVIAGTSKAVLVNRGWLPEAEASPERLAAYNQPSGEVTVVGRIALSQKPPRGPAPPPATPQQAWYRVDIEAIQPQMPYELLPIYLVQSPDGAEPGTLPYRRTIEVDLSEGRHMGYAIQWFAFSLLLGGGYVYYISQHTKTAGTSEREGKK